MYMGRNRKNLIHKEKIPSVEEGTGYVSELTALWAKIKMEKAKSLSVFYVVWKQCRYD